MTTLRQLTAPTVIMLGAVAGFVPAPLDDGEPDTLTRPRRSADDGASPIPSRSASASATDGRNSARRRPSRRLGWTPTPPGPLRRPSTRRADALDAVLMLWTDHADENVRERRFVAGGCRGNTCLRRRRNDSRNARRNRGAGILTQAGGDDATERP
jgi:hypothetical protein